MIPTNARYLAITKKSTKLGFCRLFCVLAGENGVVIQMSWEVVSIVGPRVDRCRFFRRR